MLTGQNNTERMKEITDKLEAGIQALFSSDQYAAYAWCCAFVWWVFRQAGAASLFYGGAKTAYCPAVESYARAHWQWVTSNYQPGDCVLFDFGHGQKGVAGHIGIVESVGQYGIVCIEGNTSTTSNDNGGAVMRRTRYAHQIRGAYGPAYSAVSAETEDSEMLTYEQFTAYMDRYTAEKAASATPAWAAAAWDKAKAAGLMDGTRPNAPLTRAEFAVIENRKGELDKQKTCPNWTRIWRYIQ